MNRYCARKFTSLEPKLLDLFRCHKRIRIVNRIAIAKNKLTLRAALYCTLAVAGRAELVDHSSDVLHPFVHKSLNVVHVEQVEPLQTTLQSRDLAPGIAQAG